MIKKVIVLFFILIFSSVYSQTETMKLITPPSLQRGDRIAIVAPAGILKTENQL